MLLLQNPNRMRSATRPDSAACRGSPNVSRSSSACARRISSGRIRTGNHPDKSAGALFFQKMLPLLPLSAESPVFRVWSRATPQGP